ncbi:hypothetical protein UG55_1027122 [Frankia sp. EI5c]|uniref:hypothetical protein n=1 Tax=Frankia sp. EI5c TaxID=683316 RepID=UPI0007C32B52|nr:hypothetical protein [Frankia sp. EI5c]OAA25014.1 hypothetical protein UG55_1027122 [Frankia sp. EI5c]
MLDVEVPAGVNPASGRVAGTGAATWAEQKRPLLVAGSFVVAIVLGVVIGLVWASDDQPAAERTATEQPDAPELRPVLPAVDWETSREPGRPVKVSLTPAQRAAIRVPLQWLAAWQVRTETGAATPVASDVNVPDGLYYGAIQGASREQDVFWAVGRAEISGVPDSDARNPYVWMRDGSAPWALVAHGPGACARIPQPLMDVWGSPGVCAG